MPTVIDSKVEPLPAPTIISTMIGELDLGGVPPQAALASIAKEMTMPNVNLVQVGNTVFIGHRGEGEKKNMMWGRAFNVDTAQNFVANGLKYFTYLQNLGITKYRTEYDGQIYDSAFKTWKRYVDKGDSKMAVGLYSDGVSRVYVSLGKMPLSEVM
jgi:hypothetical protein|tara:strand:- start:191 stop:658 length:468 start_codon:yes stop_codon:yes gene_type:complete